MYETFIAEAYRSSQAVRHYAGAAAATSLVLTARGGGCVASLQGRMFTSHDTTATMDRFVKFYFLQQFGYARCWRCPMQS